MANNDFLSQFSNENYKKENKPETKQIPKEVKAEPTTQPKIEKTKVETVKKPERIESFKEEKRVKVQKEPINPLLIIIPSMAALVIAAVLIYIFVFPHIVVPNFVGSSKEDVSAWIKQQQIETQGIILKEEYNFDAPVGQVLSQIPETGKVKKNAKMTFVVSKGADPDETVFVPELEQMSKAEIESWIKENKLSNTKISTAYNDEVEDGKVISTSYANGYDSSNFKRGTQLKISISKGPKPADQVTVENFVKSDYSTVEAWAEKNKIKLTKTERYSDTIPLGSVISQSLEANKKLNQGDSFSVVVSKGKEIKMINVVGTSETEATKLLTKAGIEFVTRERYSTSPIGTIIDQSYSAGETMNDVEDLKIYISLGSMIKPLGDVTNISALENLKDSLNSQDAKIKISKNEKELYYSDHSKGEILSLVIEKGGKNYQSNESFPIGSTISVVYSSGKFIKLNCKSFEGSDGKLNTLELVDYLSENGISFKLNTSANTCTIKTTVFDENSLTNGSSIEEITSDKYESLYILEDAIIEIND